MVSRSFPRRTGSSNRTIRSRSLSRCSSPRAAEPNSTTPCSRFPKAVSSLDRISRPILSGSIRTPPSVIVGQWQTERRTCAIVGHHGENRRGGDRAALPRLEGGREAGGRPGHGANGHRGCRVLVARRTPHAGTRIRGPRMAAFFETYEIHQGFERQEIVVSGDLAFVRGMEINQVVPRDGSLPMEIRQRAFSILFRGPDGVWRFARGMTNRPP